MIDKNYISIFHAMQKKKRYNENNESKFYWVQIYFDWIKIYFDTTTIFIFETFQQPYSSRPSSKAKKPIRMKFSLEVNWHEIFPAEPWNQNLICSFSLFCQLNILVMQMFVKGPSPNYTSNMKQKKLRGNRGSVIRSILEVKFGDDA